MEVTSQSEPKDLRTSREYEGQPSPFSDFLHTNHAPSAEENHQISQILSHPVTRLNNLDEELVRLQAQVDEVARKRDELKDYIDAHKALLSPIRRLPPEILAEVFINCLPTNRNPARSIIEAPLLLGRICSSWRRIALNTPRLWASIHIVIPTHYDPSKITSVVKLRCEACQAWLSRSGTLPISLSLVTANNGYSADVSASPLLESLLKFSMRWRNVSLRVPYGLLRPFSKLTKADVPWLETLKIDDIFNWDQAYQWHFPLLEAPRLHNVSFVHFQGNPHHLPLTWSLLSELSLETDASESCLQPYEVLDILQKSSNLEACALGIRSHFHTDPFYPPPIPIQLPNLTTLKLRAYPEHANELENVFDHIATPNLRELSVNVFVNYDFHSAPALHVPFRALLMQAPGSIKLEKLTLVHPRISTDALIACLRLIPTLTYLCITDSSWMWPPLPPIDLPGPGPAGGAATNATDDFGGSLLPILNDTFFSQFTKSTSCPDPLCPNLETFLISQGSAFSDSMLLKFAKARWHLHQPSLSSPDILTPDPSSSTSINHTLQFTPPIKRLKRLEVRFSRVMGAPSPDDEIQDITSEVIHLREAGMQLWVEWLIPSSLAGYSDSPWEGLPADPIEETVGGYGGGGGFGMGGNGGWAFPPPAFYQVPHQHANAGVNIPIF